MKWMVGFLVGALVVGQIPAVAGTITRQIRIRVVIPQIQSADVVVDRAVGVSSRSDSNGEVELTARLNTNAGHWKVSCTKLRGASVDIVSVSGQGRWHSRGRKRAYIVTPSDNEVRVRVRPSSEGFAPTFSRVAVTLVPD